MLKITNGSASMMRDLIRPAAASPFACLAAMLSTAFLRTFVSACERRRPSASNRTGCRGASVSNVIAGWATRCRNTACCSSSCAISGRMTGDGIRANEENSSTIRPISPTCRMIVSVHCSKTSRSVSTSFAYLRLSRSAESWMGVSGFLISCAMRHIGPCSGPLRGNEVRNVVKRHDETARIVAALTLNLHAQRACIAAPLYDHLAAGARRGLAHGAVNETRQLRNNVAVGFSDDLFGSKIEEPRSCAVDDGNPPLGIEAQHARADARKNGFHESPAFIDVAVGLHKLGALCIQFGEHAVKGPRERRDFVVTALDIDVRLQVAARDPLGGANQPRHRVYDPVGGPKAKPDRCQQQDERDDDIQGGKSQLQSTAFGLKSVILAHRCLL